MLRAASKSEARESQIRANKRDWEAKPPQSLSYLGLSLAEHFLFLVRRFLPRRAKKRRTITIKYHTAGGESAVSESPNVKPLAALGKPQRSPRRADYYPNMRYVMPGKACRL